MWTPCADTRRRYVRGMTQLAVWYVRVLLERGEISPADVPWALCKRVDLYRLTDFWSGRNDTDDGLADPEWMRVAHEITAWVRSTPMAEVKALEERVLALLEPSLERRLPRDVGPPPVQPFECWTYEPGWPGLADAPGRLGKLRNPAHVGAMLRKMVGLRPRPSRDGVLHIMNVVVPRSPFEDMPRLARTLLALIDDVRERHPEVRELWCNTWLNDQPKFLTMFPSAWRGSARVSPPGNYRNWWGQFARRDGDFNETAAQAFRDSGGVFRYRALLCHAGLEEIARHLEQNFGRG